MPVSSMPKFLGNWEMNDNSMSDDDIMDNFQYNNCYVLLRDFSCHSKHLFGRLVVVRRVFWGRSITIRDTVSQIWQLRNTPPPKHKNRMMQAETDVRDPATSSSLQWQWLQKYVPGWFQYLLFPQSMCLTFLNTENPMIHQ